MSQRGHSEARPRSQLAVCNASPKQRSHLICMLQLLSLDAIGGRHLQT